MTDDCAYAVLVVVVDIAFAYFSLGVVAVFFCEIVLALPVLNYLACDFSFIVVCGDGRNLTVFVECCLGDVGDIVLLNLSELFYCIPYCVADVFDISFEIVLFNVGLSVTATGCH